jgi:hypothetical protein
LTQNVRVSVRAPLDWVIGAAAAATVLAGTVSLLPGPAGVGGPRTLVPAAATPAAPAPTPSRPAAKPRRPAPRAHRRPTGRRPLYPLPAAAVQPEPCPPPPWHGPTAGPLPLGPPAVPESALPAALPVRPRTAQLGPVTGKGIWLTVWPDSRVDVPALVARARAAGMHQLWVRTGDPLNGFYGGRLLATLLPAAHRAGIAVIAWDFPTLSNPVADAARAARTLAYSVAGQRVDGFTADLETGPEGVHMDPRRVAVYLSRVRAVIGSRPLVATVFRPLDGLAGYPYLTEARYVDAFAPMDYWSCSEPGAVVAASIETLDRLRPVLPVGQSYDMGPEGGRPGLPTGREIWRFFDVAHRLGALGASLFDWEQTGPAQWAALAGYPWPGR